MIRLAKRPQSSEKPFYQLMLKPGLVVKCFANHCAVNDIQHPYTAQTAHHVIQKLRPREQSQQAPNLGLLAALCMHKSETLVAQIIRMRNYQLAMSIVAGIVAFSPLYLPNLLDIKIPGGFAVQAMLVPFVLNYLPALPDTWANVTKKKLFYEHCQT